MNKLLKIVFANGHKIEVPVFSSYVLYHLQETHRSPIITIDRVPTALWGMSKSEIRKAKKESKSAKPIVQIKIERRKQGFLQIIGRDTYAQVHKAITGKKRKK